MSGIKLNHMGEKIVRRGGDDKFDDDGLLIAEIMQRAPGMSLTDYQQTFIALRVEYGEEALRAVQTGHVSFVLVKQDQENG